MNLTPIQSILVGLAVGLGMVGFLALLPGEDHVVWAAVSLATVGAIYWGFAISEGRTSGIAIQGVAMLVFVAVGSIGITEGSEELIGAGWLAHAGWDYLHHIERGFTKVRSWYPPVCAVVDFVVGVPLVAGWL